MKYFRVAFILFFLYVLNIKVFIKNYDYVISFYDSGLYNYLEVEKSIVIEDDVLETFYGTITAYDPFCYGCIGITASGFDVKNTIYYDDQDYGRVRIVAFDEDFPFGTIIRVSNIPNYESFIAIVLDRGSSIGFLRFSQADLLFSDDYLAYEFGKYDNVRFDVLRYGY